MVHDQVRSGKMPPQDSTQPDVRQRQRFIKQLGQAIRAGKSERRGVVLRRLNRAQYNHTVNDLFSTNLRVVGLPDDNSVDGFDTVGEGLSVSAEAMQAYLQAADQVLDGV